MTFTENLTTKLNLAVEPKLVPLAALAETADITTANTITTVASYGSPKLGGFDVIQFAYKLIVANVSGNDEGIQINVNIGGQALGTTTTVVDDTTIDYWVTGSAVSISSNQLMVNVKITDLDSLTYEIFYIVDRTNLDEITFTAKNTSTASAGLTIEGVGGYIILDKVNRV